MTSYTLNVQPQTQYTIEYANQRGPQGPAGAAGPATTDASLLASGTLSDARLSANVALENIANVFTAKQSFSGTDHVGLCLNSLTTVQYNALTAANGDLFRDSTTDRIDARLARGMVELIDSAGGQVVAGNLAVTTLMVGGASGPLLRNNAGTVGVRNNANSADGPFACGSIAATGDATFSGGGTTQIACNGIRRQANNSTFTILASGAAATGTFTSITLSPLADGSLAQTSGNFRIVAITPTYNQTSGTAANTDLLINRTETAVGSGAQLFADFHVGGSSRFSVSNTGNLTASGTLRVGGGTVVASILSATATLDFPSISSNHTETLTITVTGAVAGDSVFLGVPAGLEAGLIFCASVTAADTVTVRMHNSSGVSVDPASGTFRATVIRF
jgi:hypothetical protein